jgi:hypothetical protein
LPSLGGQLLLFVSEDSLFAAFFLGRHFILGLAFGFFALFDLDFDLGGLLVEVGNDSVPFVETLQDFVGNRVFQSTSGWRDSADGHQIAGQAFVSDVILGFVGEFHLEAHGIDALEHLGQGAGR